MPSTNRTRVKGRSDKERRHLGIPYEVLVCPKYPKLSAWSVKLLVDIGFQFNGHNNGDLCATWSMMEKRGWKSKSTLNRALKNLMRLGFIEKTRQGGKHQCSLYALSWKPIDECKNKLEVNATRVASKKWAGEEEHPTH